PSRVQEGCEVLLGAVSVPQGSRAKHQGRGASVNILPLADLVRTGCAWHVNRKFKAPHAHSRDDVHCAASLRKSSRADKTATVSWKVFQIVLWLAAAAYAVVGVVAITGMLGSAREADMVF